jgi:type IV secretion system protein VirB6
VVLMANWQFFQALFTGLVTPLLAQIQAMIGNVVDVVQPVAVVLVGLWMALVGIEVANGHKTIQAVSRDFLLAAFFLGLLQSDAIYMRYVGNLFLTVIPNGTAGAFGAQQSPAAGMDHVLNTAMGEALLTYQALPWSLAAIPLGIGIVFFVVVALVATGFGFGIYVLAVFTVVVCVFVGPVFLGLAVAPATRKFAAGWLAVTVAGVVTQMIALAVLLLLTAAEGTSLTQTAATITTGDNSINMLIELGQCGVLMFLCTIVIKEIPGLARAIAGGVWQNVSAINSATFGAAAAAGGAAAGAARGVAGAVGQNAARQIGAGAARRMRPTMPVGQSLSKGNP